jgi:putative flippase GtrA
MSALRWNPERRRIIRFCVVGGTGVLVNMAIFSGVRLGLEMLPELARENTAVVAGFAISCLSNFLLNDRWTWGDRRESTGKTFFQRLLTYYLVALAAGGVQLIAFNVLLPMLPAMPYRAHGANFLGIALGTGVNFWVNNRWTFGKQKTGGR